jgi:hypothetical protein
MRYEGLTPRLARDIPFTLVNKYVDKCRVHVGYLYILSRRSTSINFARGHVDGIVRIEPPTQI